MELSAGLEEVLELSVEVRVTQGLRWMTIADQGQGLWGLPITERQANLFSTHGRWQLAEALHDVTELGIPLDPQLESRAKEVLLS